MAKLISKAEYEAQTALTRDKRMAWWREARFGMFIHYGLYSLVGRNEWVMSLENYPIEEYEKLANQFNPKPGAPREWARLAKTAGMKYMVLTTRHHEGFSLWDSKVNPYNSVQLGPKRDIVREYVDACREFGLRIGFYFSLMDWHHPDSWRCAFDPDARKRFIDFIQGMVRELMTQYGKIDILWYDVPRPMEHWEGWDSIKMNLMVRELQPEIIINNRSRLDEDFGTPEERITPMESDWEACMTFNGISWGYVDSEQVKPYSYTPQQIIKMLARVSYGGGNLLLNIGPTPDGSVPNEVIAPLTAVGKWLSQNGDATYGKLDKFSNGNPSGVGSVSMKGNKVYYWNWIWPSKGEMSLGGFMTPLKAVRILHDGSPVKFEQHGQRILLKDLPTQSPDKVLGIAVLELEFEEKPKFMRCSMYPQLHGGRDLSGMF